MGGGATKKRGVAMRFLNCTFFWRVHSTQTSSVVGVSIMNLGYKIRNGAPLLFHIEHISQRLECNLGQLSSVLKNHLVGSTSQIRNAALVRQLWPCCGRDAQPPPLPPPPPSEAEGGGGHRGERPAESHWGVFN